MLTRHASPAHIRQARRGRPAQPSPHTPPSGADGTSAATPRIGLPRRGAAPLHRQPVPLHRCVELAPQRVALRREGVPLRGELRELRRLLGQLGLQLRVLRLPLNLLRGQTVHRVQLLQIFRPVRRVDPLLEDFPLVELLEHLVHVLPEPQLVGLVLHLEHHLVAPVPQHHPQEHLLPRFDRVVQHARRPLVHLLDRRELALVRVALAVRVAGLRLEVLHALKVGGALEEAAHAVATETILDVGVNVDAPNELHHQATLLRALASHLHVP